MPYKQLTDEELAHAEAYLGEGRSFADVSRETGISQPTLYKRFPQFVKQKKDPTPSASKRRGSSSRKAGPTDEQLTMLFAKMASAPAIPMGLWVHCDFCAMHFATQGPKAATQLVELSKDHPALRSVMERCWQYWDEVAWAGVLTMWAGVPIAHHASPDWVYRWIEGPLGLPPRGGAPVSSNGHVHAPPTQSDPGPTPFGGFDMESVMRMAETMGIKIEIPDDLVTSDASAPSSETTDTAESAEAAESAQASTPDSDSSE